MMLVIMTLITLILSLMVLIRINWWKVWKCQVFQWLELPQETERLTTYQVIIIIIIIIIITRPRPAFGRLGLGGSLGGYTYHGYTSHASPRACGARLGQKKQELLEICKNSNVLTFQPSFYPSSLPTFWRGGGLQQKKFGWSFVIKSNNGLFFSRCFFCFKPPPRQKVGMVEKRLEGLRGFVISPVSRHF